jgi:single-stranded-DNA-specific exonuclease
LHIRDALQQIADLRPDVFIKFGGHKGAAGLTVYRSKLDTFHELFENTVRTQLNGVELAPTVWTDGVLETALISLNTVQELEQLQPYGREFEPPVFENTFQVIALRTVGPEAKHLALALKSAGDTYRAIWFRVGEENPTAIAVGDTVRCAFRLVLNEFRGTRNLNLIIEYAYKIA